MMTAELDDLMTVAEAAEKLRLSRHSVYNLIYRGKLRAVKAGGAIRISKTALAECLTSAN